MKINRSELERGFKNKLFDIPVEGLHLEDVRIENDPMECILSADPFPKGIKLSGSLKVHFLESCDRCLESLVEVHTTKVNCLLTPIKAMIDDFETQVIYFNSTDLEVDIGPILKEIILLEESWKRLCREDCKGLCPTCGINQNFGTCECHDDSSDSPWDALKQI